MDTKPQKMRNKWAHYISNYWVEPSTSPGKQLFYLMDILLKIYEDYFTLELQLLSLICVKIESVCQIFIFLLSSKQILLAPQSVVKIKSWKIISKVLWLPFKTMYSVVYIFSCHLRKDPSVTLGLNLPRTICTIMCSCFGKNVFPLQ